MSVTADLEAPITRLGTELAHQLPRHRKLSPARAEQRLTELMTGDPELRAALFRFVDVRPACGTPHDLTRHLRELLEEAADGSATARRAARALRRPLAERPVAAAAGQGVDRMAHRFIVGADARDALPAIRRLWRSGVGTTVDLLGEATVTEDEADRYAERCAETMRVLAEEAGRHPAPPDGLARVNLSVKVSALTTQLRPLAPERGIAGARPRLQRLLGQAHELGAHLHVDMESFDTRDAVDGLTKDLLPEFPDVSAGIVLQAYLTESPEHLDALLDWCSTHPRAVPLTVRLVKGAYWDHEVVEAAQHGWTAPVFTDKRATDRTFERLTRTLLDASREGIVRTAIASHNLRSIAHAAAYADATRVPDGALEFQVLRGLGDDTQQAIAATGRRVRCYCPVGDLVAGMAYLVRRLLENTANDSFLAAQAGGQDLTTLLEAP